MHRHSLLQIVPLPLLVVVYCSSSSATRLGLATLEWGGGGAALVVGVCVCVVVVVVADDVVVLAVVVGCCCVSLLCWLLWL